MKIGAFKTKIGNICKNLIFRAILKFFLIINTSYKLYTLHESTLSISRRHSEIENLRNESHMKISVVTVVCLESGGLIQAKTELF